MKPATLRRKVLLVDDSETTLMMERMVIGPLDCDIVTAKNGEEALERALAERPDLIVMDVEMPKLTGFEACRRLRVQPDTRNIPVLLITSRGDAQHMRTGYECGCAGYLRKPVRSADLLARVRHFLGI